MRFRIPYQCIGWLHDECPALINDRRQPLRNVGYDKQRENLRRLLVLPSFFLRMLTLVKMTHPPSLDLKRRHKFLKMTRRKSHKGPHTIWLFFKCVTDWVHHAKKSLPIITCDWEAICILIGYLNQLTQIVTWLETQIVTCRYY